MSQPSKKQALASSAPAFQPGVSAPLLSRPQALTAGDAASPEATVRLKAAVDGLKAAATRPVLEQAVAAIKRGDWKGGGDRALEALGIDERSGLAWWLLAISRDKAGDLKSALSCYEAALQLLPEHDAIANDLGRLAFRLGQKDVAERLFTHYLAAHPGHPEAANNLACALRDQQRFDEAIDVLKPTLAAHPDSVLMWNTLGTVVNERGDIDEAITFYGEALRLDPKFARARYNRGNARLTNGELDGALEDVEAGLAAADAEDRPMMRLALALALIARGDLERGWAEYEVRNDPAYSDATRFLIERSRWAPDTDLAGKTLLVVGEQGLGDEILFANALPDVLRALGPDGTLVLAVETRQVKLFQQSFPQATVGAHATFKVDGRVILRAAPFVDLGGVDCWTPMGSLLRRFRPSVDSFPTTPSFLRADPARVAHWRETLSTLGPEPKIGVLWKSLKVDSARQRFFAAFDLWRETLKTPGVRFVNLQYGDCAEELAAARAEGLEVWNPTDIDLKDDLDEVAALACALDLVIGPANATTNIAAACGARVWLVSEPGAWPMLGTDRYPWYPTVRAFVTPTLNRWDLALAAVNAALPHAF
jgi:tetratricopeptide (TPR) repeat protein